MENLRDNALMTSSCELSSNNFSPSHQEERQEREEEHENVAEAAQNFIESSFAPCDNSLVNDFAPNRNETFARSLFPSSLPYRGKPILKPTLSSSSSSLPSSNQHSHQQQQQLITTSSLIFPNLLVWVKFYSAAATLDLKQIESNNNNNNNNNNKNIVRVLSQQELSLLRVDPVLVRHERMFKHPVSTGTMIQSGCQVKIDNRSEASKQKESNSKKKRTKNADANNPSWNLFWGGRWKDDDVFRSECLQSSTRLQISSSSSTLLPNKLQQQQRFHHPVALDQGSIRVNHFPGTHQLARKDNLAICLRKIKSQFPNDFGFAPQTFILPRDSSLFQAELMKFKNEQTVNLPIFIAKPPASSRGRGVFLFRPNNLPEGVSQWMSTSSSSSFSTPSSISTPSSVSASRGGDAKQKNQQPAIKKKKKKEQKEKSKRSASSKTTESQESEDSATNEEDEDEDDEEESKDDENSEEDDNQEEEEEEEEQGVLVQRYIPNPLTLHGYKVDLRVYVLVTSFDPLKVFVFNDGLVRFATVPFNKNSNNMTSNKNDANFSSSPKQQQQEQQAPLSNLCAHLTNVSVNVKQQTQQQQQQNENRSKRKEYQKTDLPEQDGTEEGSKWSIQALKKFITAREGEKAWNECWTGVCRAVTKTLISVQEDVSSKANSLLQRRNACFEFYGFDVLLDDELKPHVLEVNVLPSLVCNSALDRHIKGHMIADMLSLVGIGLVIPPEAAEHVNQKRNKTESQNQEEEKEETEDENLNAALSMLHCPIISAAARKKSSSSSNNSNTVSDEEAQQKLDSLIDSWSKVNSEVRKMEEQKEQREEEAEKRKKLKVQLQQRRKKFFSCVSDDSDRAIVSYAEEELLRKGGFERVFPTASSVSELKHLFSSSSSSSSVKRGNRILWAWESVKSTENSNINKEQMEALKWMRTSPVVVKKEPIKPLVVETPAPTPTPKKAAPPAKVVPAKRSTSKKPVVIPPRVATIPQKKVQQVATSAASLSLQTFSFQPIQGGHK